jgi:hypothetical protein
MARELSGVLLPSHADRLPGLFAIETHWVFHVEHLSSSVVRLHPQKVVLQ